MKLSIELNENISTENPSTEEETVLCFECDKCDDKFVAQDDLEGHMDVTHINPNYFCDKCEFSSVGKTLCDEHTKNLPEKCEQCGKMFHLKIGLTEHKETEHNKVETQGNADKLKCNLCDLDVTNEQDLVEHKVKGHKESNVTVSTSYIESMFKENEKLKKEIKHLKDDFERLNDIFEISKTP